MSGGTEFDYRAAWREAAEPCFTALPEAVKDLLRETCEVAENCPQDKACNMVWPEDDGALRAKFEAFDDTMLATAANVVYFYGHWSNTGVVAETVGGTWKFSLYCTMVLRDRLGIPQIEVADKGVSIRVHDGCLRVGFSSHWSWTWLEIGLATRENFDRAKMALLDVEGVNLNWLKSDRKMWDDYEDRVMAVAKKLRAKLTPKDAPFSYFFDDERFKVPYGTLAAQDEAREQTRREDELRPKLDIIATAAAAIWDTWADTWKDKASREVTHFLIALLAS